MEKKIPEPGDSVRIHDIGYINSNFRVNEHDEYAGANVDINVYDVQRLCMIREDISVQSVDDDGDFKVAGCSWWIPNEFIKTLYAIPY